MMQNKVTVKQRKFRKLEELNLIDNFLFQEMLSQKDIGEEFARILLSTILEKPIRKVKIVPQKSILGVDTDRHGVRLDAYIEDVSDELNGGMTDAEVVSDIYDMEPNLTYESENLPRRTRFYHGMIDTQFFEAGAAYDKLPNVIIIMILPYDPFGRNRMVYTIQNHCTEIPDLPYDDGAKKIFLYTKGTEGNPSQELKDMLKYIQKTTDDNVTNSDIASIHQFVHKVKLKKEVGINYMKSWEIEKMVRDEAYHEGYEEGRNQAKRINQLYIKLVEAGRTEEILKAAQDEEYQENLLKEFDL